MNVYKVNAHAKPPTGKFDTYAFLDSNKSDRKYLDIDNFNGRPFPKKWRRVTLFFCNPLRPRADFHNFSISKFVCNERARKLAGPALDGAGEFLPVEIEGEASVHYIYNVTTCGDFIDSKNSIWEFYEPEKIDMGLVAPAFRAASLGGKTLFKIPEDEGTEIYCVERKPAVGCYELKSLVEQHKLTGLKFELVWSENRGPIISKHKPSMEGIVWKTGDGKKYKAK